MQLETHQEVLDAIADQDATAEALERQRIIEFHGARLQWRLQQAFEDHRRRLQQPVAPGMNRPRALKVKPLGFG